MANYPVMLNLKGNNVVIVGGGKIATRKICGLLEVGAQITVISPAVSDTLKEWIEEKKISWKKKHFEPRDLQYAVLIIAATNDRKVNEHVAESAYPHQLLNVVDNIEMSNFHVPAILTRGDLTITVATDGSSPFLAKKIRDDLSEQYTDRYIDYLQFLSQVRNKIKRVNLPDDEKQTLLRKITDPAYIESHEHRENIIKHYF